MDKFQLELLYNDFLEDIDFEKLELLIKKPNIFRILGVEHYELRHSNFLAWLLNPNESHNLGTLFLRKFLKQLFIDSRSKEISIIDLPSLNLDNAIIEREWKKIDILIELENVVIVIENKIYAKEHGKQLEVYKDVVNEMFPKHIKIFVFLSPFGYESSLNDLYINISYESIIRILKNIIGLLDESISHSMKTYINDYINNLEINIMQSNEINELAKKIYRNHKDFFDFVNENKPDEAHELKLLLEKEVISRGWILGSSNRGFVRFLTPKLDAIIPKGYASGWSKNESFLFEINFLYSAKDKIRIYATIDKTDIEFAQIIKPILDKIEGKENKNRQWLCYLNKYHTMDLFDIMNDEKSKIQKHIDKIIKKAEENVLILEDEILKKENEIIALNNKRKNN
jgi:hypothetical protein